MNAIKLTRNPITYGCLAVILVCISCDTVTDSDLTNELWTLQRISYGDGVTVIIDNPNDYSVIFFEDGACESVSDCNRCVGDFEIIEEFISIRLVCTEQYCGEDSLDPEFEYSMVSATSYEISGKRLLIYFNENKDVLTFRK